MINAFPLGKSSKKVMWASIGQIKFSSDDKNKMFYKYDYTEEYRECVFREERRLQERKILHEWK